MTRKHRLPRIPLLGLLPAVFLLAGCDFFTIEESNRTGGITAAPVTATPSAANETSATPAESPASNPTPVGGSGIGPQGEGGGFLWKPSGESTGKLVVLLPPQYTGHVSACFVGTRGGSVIEQGNYAGVHNGDREHYRYSKPGSAYPAGVVVVADLKSGGSVHWPIPSPGSRTEY